APRRCDPGAGDRPLAERRADDPAARRGPPGGRAWSECLLGDLRELLERHGIAHGEVGEHLAVDLDAGLAEPIHQAAVRQLMLPRGGVDARDPETAEVRLAAAAV